MHWIRPKSATLLLLICLAGQMVTAQPHTSQSEVPKRALVLSGGGARGLAHIGVLKALEELGFYPDLIVGSSIGAVVGALYACGNTPAEVENFFKTTDWEEILSERPYREIEFVAQKMTDYPALLSLRFDKNLNVIFPRNLLSTQGLQERIFQLTIHPDYAARSNFDSLAIPFRAMATDIRTGRSIMIDEGNLAKTLSASSAFPFVLAPVEEGDFLFVDGGLTDNVPCDVAWEMGAEFIVAVDVSSKVITLESNFDPVQYFGQAMNTLAYPSDTRNLGLADVLVLPEIGSISSADFDSIDVLIERGYQKTREFSETIVPYAKGTRPNPDFMENSVQALNRTYIRKIKYRGNRSTRPFIIRRELMLKEGNLWNLGRAERSIKNLFSTGLFENVYLSLENAAPDSADLIIEVKEYERSLFSFGTRYDSERDARAFLTFQYRNLFGVGVDNQFSMIASNQFRKLEWNARTVRIVNSTLTGFFSLYYIFEDIPMYNDGNRIGFGRFTRTGLDAYTGVQIARVGMTSAGLRYERFYCDENVTHIPRIPATNYNYASLNVRTLIENLDDPSLPTRGRRNEVSYSHSISQDEWKHFDRLTIDIQHYDTFWKRYTIISQVHIGYLNRALSYYEKFRLGGLNSLPGFHQDELWGNVLVNLGLGLRAPISRGSYYRMQFMTGKTWNHIDEINWRELHFGGSLGILIPTPLGPLSIDYGVDSRLHGLLYFALGHPF